MKVLSPEEVREGEDDDPWEDFRNYKSNSCWDWESAASSCMLSICYWFKQLCYEGDNGKNEPYNHQSIVDPEAYEIVLYARDEVQRLVCVVSKQDIRYASKHTELIVTTNWP